MNVQAERRLAPVPSVAARRPGTIRVLLVDDDERLRELLSLHLWRAGFDVRLAEDAVEAGHLILDTTPDIMIVDVNMPYLNGFEFVAMVRADRTIPFIPVIFLAMHRDAAIRAREFGGTCLLKPVQAEKLLASVASSATDRPLQSCDNREPVPG